MSEKGIWRGPCDGVTLAAWHVLVQGLIEGKASEEEILALERSIATGKVSVWMEALVNSTGKERNVLPDVMGICELEQASEELEERVVRNGFLCLVEGKSKEDRKLAQRSIAALLLDPVRVKRLVFAVFANNLPEWCRAQCLRASRVETNKPAACPSNSGLVDAVPLSTELDHLCEPGSPRWPSPVDTCAD